MKLLFSSHWRLLPDQPVVVRACHYHESSECAHVSINEVACYRTIRLEDTALLPHIRQYIPRITHPSFPLTCTDAHTRNQTISLHDTRLTHKSPSFSHTRNQTISLHDAFQFGVRGAFRPGNNDVSFGLYHGAGSVIGQPGPS